MDKKSKSEQIHDELNRLAAKFYIFDITCFHETGIPIELQDESFLLKEFYELRKLKYQFIETFNKLYEQSIEDNYLWQYCSVKVYKSHLEQIKIDFFKRYNNANEEDFFINEIENILYHYQDQKEETYPYPYKEKTKSLVPSSYIYNIPKEEKYQVLYILKEEKARISYFLNNDITKKIKYSQDRKLDLLNSLLQNKQSKKIESESNDSIKEEKANPYPHIFKNKKSFDLFEWYQQEIKNQLADYSFIFNEMKQAGYIYDTVRPADFVKFLSKEYLVFLDKLRPYGYNRTKKHLQFYSTAKRLFKLSSTPPE